MFGATTGWSVAAVRGELITLTVFNACVIVLPSELRSVGARLCSDKRTRHQLKAKQTEASLDRRKWSSKVRSPGACSVGRRFIVPVLMIIPVLVMMRLVVLRCFRQCHGHTGAATTAPSMETDGQRCSSGEHTQQERDEQRKLQLLLSA